MLTLALVFFLMTAAPATPAPALASQAPVATDFFSPIFLYQGTWQVPPGMPGTGADTIANQCREFTEYFACQQTVNGKVGALVVYVYGGTTGHYNSQAILPKGFATGRGDLLIEGERWTFPGK